MTNPLDEILKEFDDKIHDELYLRGDYPYEFSRTDFHYLIDGVKKFLSSSLKKAIDQTRKEDYQRHKIALGKTAKVNYEVGRKQTLKEVMKIVKQGWSGDELEELIEKLK